MKSYFLFSQKKKCLNNKFDIHNFPVRRSFSGRLRLLFSLFCFLALYGVMGACLISYGLEGGQIEEAKGPSVPQLTARPDIVDRNNRLLATDIKTYSLFAEPRRIIDVDETIELLSTVLPLLNWQEAYKRLKKNLAFLGFSVD